MLLSNVSLTEDQVAYINAVAAAFGGDAGRSMAIKEFEAFHEIRDGKWVLKDTEDSAVLIRKQDDGSYWITAVSTAALKDREGETFEVGAIDYDAAEAARTGDYPEFRMFHSPMLGIGKVEKMMRAGIFAIDQGPSYTDPFSLSVCETMLSSNNGKYRCSRGFRVVEASGNCPQCEEGLVINYKHMVAGFKCPSCGTVHPQYKNVLKDVHFRKARTFDVTITDVPCVPWTGVTAAKISNDQEDFQVNKKELKQKLLAGGVPEDVVDQRLAEVSEDRLKELDDLPEATLLKEFAAKEEEQASDNDQTFVLDPEVLKDFTKIVHTELEAVLKDLEIEVPDMDVEVKELPGLTAIEDRLKQLEAKMDQLLERDEDRLKELMADAPRGSKLRITRYKAKKAAAADEEEDAADQGDDEEAEGEGTGNNKKLPSWLRKELGVGMKEQPTDVIVGADGRTASTLTEFLTGGND